MKHVFYAWCFQHRRRNQKQYVINQNEIYVKKCCYIMGGTLFGRATDDPQSPAKTVLGVMIVRMLARPTFYFKNFAHYKIEFAIFL